MLDPLKEIITELDEPFFIKLGKTLANKEFNQIKKLIREMINDDAHPAVGQAGVFQRCFAIRPEINGLLDLVRRTFSERIKDINGTNKYLKKIIKKRIFCCKHFINN